MTTRGSTRAHAVGQEGCRPAPRRRPSRRARSPSGRRPGRGPRRRSPGRRHAARARWRPGRTARSGPGGACPCGRRRRPGSKPSTSAAMRVRKGDASKRLTSRIGDTPRGSAGRERLDPDPGRRDGSEAGHAAPGGARRALLVRQPPSRCLRSASAATPARVRPAMWLMNPGPMTWSAAKLPTSGQEGPSHSWTIRRWLPAPSSTSETSQQHVHPAGDASHVPVANYPRPGVVLHLRDPPGGIAQRAERPPRRHLDQALARTRPSAGIGPSGSGEGSSATPRRRRRPGRRRPGGAAQRCSSMVTKGLESARAGAAGRRR